MLTAKLDYRCPNIQETAVIQVQHNTDPGIQIQLLELLILRDATTLECFI